jgi:8-oxo-dGTP pyrophosphatase MutT (NUDIX family)
VFRTDGPSVRILLVRAKKDPSKWIFPKGHLKSGESHGAAALREANEEAGVRGTVVGLIGAQTFRSGDEMVRVEYYLIHLAGEIPSPEGRDKQWLSPPDAIEQVAFPDARDLLRMALPEIERYVAPAADRDS